MNNDSTYELPKGRQRVEVITSVQRRRRWSPAEKKGMLGISRVLSKFKFSH